MFSNLSYDLFVKLEHKKCLLYFLQPLLKSLDIIKRETLKLLHPVFVFKLFQTVFELLCPVVVIDSMFAIVQQHGCTAGRFLGGSAAQAGGVSHVRAKSGFVVDTRCPRLVDLWLDILEEFVDVKDPIAVTPVKNHTQSLQREVKTLRDRV
ncbi:hypothetical protein HG531_006677 [Fusarium graminearum]|nr:hypothetical protein HG531_006677 [Fusarium graminearum]